jgi:hypothetical protein
VDWAVDQVVPDEAFRNAKEGEQPAWSNWNSFTNWDPWMQRSRASEPVRAPGSFAEKEGRRRHGDKDGWGRS